MLRGCGLRQSELVALELRQVEQRESAPLAHGTSVGKGGRKRSVPAPGWVTQSMPGVALHFDRFFLNLVAGAGADLSSQVCAVQSGLATLDCFLKA
jgi:site-specific recombinase XerC